MPGLTDLPTLLTSMQPTLREGAFVFLSMPGAAYGEAEALAPVASFAEDEGLTLVVPKDQADTHGHTYDGVFRAITLHVHSSLAAVGLTAAVAHELAEHGISANVIAAYHHDHVFVPAARAEEALHLLKALASRGRS